MNSLDVEALPGLQCGMWKSRTASEPATVTSLNSCAVGLAQHNSCAIVAMVLAKICLPFNITWSIADIVTIPQPYEVWPFDMSLKGVCQMHTAICAVRFN